MRVKIDFDDNVTIQKSFYEWKAGQTNIAFLMKDEDVKWDILQHYVNVVEYRFAELELLKDELSRKYLPEELVGANYSYEFDFQNSEIVYSVKVA